MPLKTKVKVGHITNLSDARYCAGMGVELLGFPVGPGGLSPTTYRQIIDWVSGPEFVLEITQGGGDFEEVKANFPGHYIQIGTNQLHLLEDTSTDFIISMLVGDWRVFGGRLKTYPNIKFLEIADDIPDSTLVNEISSAFPVLIRLEKSQQLHNALSLNLAGISLSGSDELRPGLKDYSSLSEILEQLEMD